MGWGPWSGRVGGRRGLRRVDLRGGTDTGDLAEAFRVSTLWSYGISTSLATRIYKCFGDVSAKVIAEEPFRLAREVWGVGFKTADTIAQAIGMAPDASADCTGRFSRWRPRVPVAGRDDEHCRCARSPGGTAWRESTGLTRGVPRWR